MPHLYLHVPFCPRRCSYCDFSIAVRRVVPVDAYLRALGAELRQAVRGEGGEATVALGPLRTVYAGGGTPSRLGGDGIARMLDLVRDTADLAPDAEITIEANPDDVTAEAARAWRAAGVNRLSLGAQSFEPRVLAWMHRTHDREAIARAVAAAREAGIGNLSLDLIFAVPAELERDWERDLAQAVALDPSHLSIYGLTVEQGTPLARWRERGEPAEAPEEGFEREFLAAHVALAAEGFEHYEVSNYARPGQRSRHNAAYWARVPYLGAGPSAHSFDGRDRWWNVDPYVEWSNRVLSGQGAIAGREALTREQEEAERIYLGLRTLNGVEVLDDRLERAREWVARGWAELAGNRLTLTPPGWLRLDTLAASLTSVASRF